MVRYYSGSSSKYHPVHMSLVYAESCLGRAARPSDFSYKHKADRSINLLLTPLSSCAEGNVLDGLWAAIDASQAGSYSHAMLLAHEFSMWLLGTSPIASLFPTFLYLHNSERLEKMLEPILELLRSGVGEELTVLDISRPSDPFQIHLETLLYGNKELNRLRVKLCVADFCWACSIHCGVRVYY